MYIYIYVAVCSSCCQRCFCRRSPPFPRRQPSPISPSVAGPSSSPSTDSEAPEARVMTDERKRRESERERDTEKTKERTRENKARYVRNDLVLG